MRENKKGYVVKQAGSWSSRHNIKLVCPMGERAKLFIYHIPIGAINSYLSSIMYMCKYTVVMKYRIVVTESSLDTAVLV